MLNESALALMFSIGHRTGLFDLLAGLPPLTSTAIAERAGLQERYVREWLNALTVGKVLVHDVEGGTYRLPAEHAALLTRAAAPDNLAAFMQYIPLLGAVEDRIIEAFRQGGGVPYSAYPRFQEVMADESSQTVLPALLEHILPLSAGLTDACTRGSTCSTWAADRDEPSTSWPPRSPTAASTGTTCPRLASPRGAPRRRDAVWTPSLRGARRRTAR